jgi:hypothetical protein
MSLPSSYSFNCSLTHDTFTLFPTIRYVMDSSAAQTSSPSSKHPTTSSLSSVMAWANTTFEHLYNLLKSYDSSLLSLCSPSSTSCGRCFLYRTRKRGGFIRYVEAETLVSNPGSSQHSVPSTSAKRAYATEVFLRRSLSRYSFASLTPPQSPIESRDRAWLARWRCRRVDLRIVLLGSG